MHKIESFPGGAPNPAGLSLLASADQSVLEAMPSAVLVLNRYGALVRCNARASELYGRFLRAGEVDVERTSANLLEDDTVLPLDEKPVAEVLRTGRPVRSREIVIDRPDGTQIFALVSVTPLFDGAGELEGACACVEDIGEQRRALQTTRDKESSLRDLLDALPAALYTTDQDGRVTYYNRAASELAGREPVVGKDQWCVAWRLYTANGDPLPLDQCPMAIALKEDRPVRDIDILAERPDGSKLPVLPFPTPLHDRNGRLLGALNLLIDINKLKLSESAAAQRAAELGALYEFTERSARAPDLADIEEAALEAILGALRCSRAAILRFDEAGAMRFAASRGLSETYKAAVDGHSPWDKDATDLKPICMDDVKTADLPKDLRTVVQAEGIGALAFVPVLADGVLAGKFMAYFDAPHTFTSQEIELALTIARQLGFSIERARSEASVRESEERFRLVAESAPVMLWMGDASGKCVYLNRQLREFWGVTPETMREFDWTITVHPEDRERLFNAFTVGMEKQNGFQVESRYQRADGSYRVLSTKALPRLGLRGEFAGMIGVNVDMTEARALEQSLREGEYRLRLAVEAAKAADWSWEAPSDHVVFSPQAAKLLGLSERSTWREVAAALNPDDLEAVRSKVQTAILAKAPYDAECRVVRPADGEEIWVSARGQGLFSPNGSMTGMIGLVTDISEQKRKEAGELLLVREVDHRAKNVLAVVQAMARLTPFQSRDQYTADLVGRISALGRVHTLLSQSRWTRVPFAKILRDELEPHVFESRDRLQMVGPPVELRSEAAQPLSIIIHELATNAAKYGAFSTDNGTLAVRWTKTPTGLSIEWREHSPGAAPAATQRSGGFGTTLIDSAVRQLGGQIRRSWSPDGLVCIIEFADLTAFSAPFEPRAAQAAFQRAGKGMAGARILVVEDEPLVAMEIAKLLEEAQAVVVGPAATLNEAMMLAMREPLDCALLDVNLGGRHVGPVLEVIANRAIPFALVTGYHDPDLPGLIIEKPIAVPEFLRTVSELLKTKVAQAAL